MIVREADIIFTGSKKLKDTKVDREIGCNDDYSDQKDNDKYEIMKSRVENITSDEEEVY